MSFYAVIFDLDGTLIDSMSIWRDVDIEFLSKRNIPVTPELFTDIPEGNSFKELAVYVKNKFDLPDTIKSICSEWTLMVKNHYENQIRLRPGVLELLSWLHENNIKMAVGTSNSLELTKLVLKKNNIAHYFQIIISGDMQLRGKPFPDIFIKAAAAIGEDPANCVVIEDTLAGVRAAKAAGMKIIAIEEFESRQDWSVICHEADYCTVNFDDILSCLKNCGGK